MKKLLCFVWGLAFILFFESCSKEKLEPTTANKANTTTQQTPEQSPPPSQQSPSCPHAPGDCPHAPCGASNG